MDPVIKIKNHLFKARILGKIYLIWFFRRIVPLMLIQIALVVFALKIFAKNVFVSKVLQNIGLVADRNYWEVFNYLLEAFLRTHIAVQVAILVGLGFIALLLRDIFRAIIAYILTLKKGKE